MKFIRFLNIYFIHIFHTQYSQFSNDQIAVKKNPGIHPMGNNTNQYAKLLQKRSKRDELVSAIGRDLTYFEYDMITYPKLCMTCLIGVQVSHYLTL